jgi:hypothetical protein
VEQVKLYQREGMMKMTLKVTVVRKDRKQKLFEYVCPEYRTKGNTFKTFVQAIDYPDSLALSISNAQATILLTGRTCEALVTSLVSNPNWYEYIKSVVDGVEEMKALEKYIADEH